jgi:hypothetical protein
MAIPLKDMRDSMKAMLDDALSEAYGATVFAVHADYYFPTQEWKIGKIEPWDDTKHWKNPVARKVVAIDEMDAYKKFMEHVGAYE